MAFPKDLCSAVAFFTASNIDKITSYNQKSILFCCNSDSSSVLLTTPILTFSLVVSTLLTPLMIPIVKRWQMVLLKGIRDCRIPRLLHRILLLMCDSQWLFSIQTWSLDHNILLEIYICLLLLEFLVKTLQRLEHSWTQSSSLMQVTWTRRALLVCSYAVGWGWDQKLFH